MSTFSEAYQEKFGRRDCPFLFECDVQVTKDFFARVCKTPAYTNCHHFAKRVGELQLPITWLQKMAIDQARVAEQDVAQKTPTE